jgi:V8-like Glu-specific endopeptidase
MPDRACAWARRIRPGENGDEIMIQPKVVLRRTAAVLLLGLAACTSTAQAPASGPQRAAALDDATAAEQAALRALTPPQSAMRVAATTSLSGTELGTMWTFENAPVDYWQRTYGFTATQEWLDRVRLASVKIPGCSASFVSPDGLILTNHHCARSCVASNSTPEMDYVTRGFYARDRSDEKLCPNAYADVLTAIEDVTTRVRAAETPGMTSGQIAAATQAEIERITAECQQRGGVCRVVPLYRGGQYQLYTYTRHAPVKLVMAPELQAGFFGGDHDNFVYPRYALDFAFYRAYEADGRTPVRTTHFFPLDETGPADGELVFITGNPGSTARLITASQLMYERSYRHPMMVSVFSAHRRVTQEQLRAASGQQAIMFRERLFGIENTLKKYQGEVAGLMDSLLVGRKLAWEAEFRERARNSAAARPWVDVWDRMLELQLRKLQLDPVLLASNAGWLGSQYLTLPANIIAYHRYAGLPDEERPAQLRGERFASYQRSLTAPVTGDAVARTALEAHFRLAAQWLPAGHPLRAVLQGDSETPEEAAERLAFASRILDADYRAQLVQGGADAVRTSTDPAVRLALVLDSINRAVLPQVQAIAAEESVQAQRLARALFAVYGTMIPPDATSTLRISDGIVQGYNYNGTIAPYRTVFHGMYARAAEFGNAAPFDLPPAFTARKQHVDMTVAMDFVSTNDITGGNSGSPIIDRQARIVGLAFDGNMEQLPNEYVFRTDTGGRTVAVHAAGILEALRSIYQAEALLAELTRSAGAAARVE